MGPSTTGTKQLIAIDEIRRNFKESSRVMGARGQMLRKGKTKRRANFL
jgi:hypothetical protein